LTLPSYDVGGIVRSSNTKQPNNEAMNGWLAACLWLLACDLPWGVSGFRAAWLGRCITRSGNGWSFFSRPLLRVWSARKSMYAPDRGRCPPSLPPTSSRESQWANNNSVYSAAQCDGLSSIFVSI